MKKSRIQKKHIFFTIAITLLIVLLTISLVLYLNSPDLDVSIPPVMQVVLLLFLLSLPILLLTLLVVYRKKRKRALSAVESVIEVQSVLPSYGGGMAVEAGETEAVNPFGAGLPAAAMPPDNDDAQIPTEEAAGQRKRFYMLSEIEENNEKYRRQGYDESITLKELCENFRNYAASRLGLYYHISDIRKFIAGLAVSRIIILQGISGTGKTSLGYAFGEYLDNPSTVIPVQPMWKERSDLIGYYNEFTKRFNETPLLQKMYEANYSKDMYITLLDEMNIARIEYYFAEFLSLLELPDPEKRYLGVVTDKWASDPAGLKNGQIKLPANMWFIGTSNNDDTTFSISDKVYDRAMVLNLDYKSEIFSAPQVPKAQISAERFTRLKDEAIKEYAVTTRNLKRLDALDKYVTETFHITFGNRIRKQIMTFVPVVISCGGDETEALDDILSKKLMRKLEMQNPVYLKNSAESFCAFLDELFGTDKMKQCKAFITRLAKNA